MQIISSYKPTPLQFSPSQIFFEKQKTLLQKLGFFPPTIIDLHITYSFQLVEEQYFMQGAEIIGYNTDHEIQDQAIVYKLGLANPKYVTIQSLFINLEDMKSRVSGSIRSTIRVFPFRQWAIFLLFIMILPSTIGGALLYLNLAGIGIMLLFSFYKTIRYFISIFRKKNTSYQGLTINYAQQSDADILTDEMIEALHTLRDLKITKVAYTGNCLYLYQEIKEKTCTASAFFSSLFQKQHELTESEKAEQTQKTLAHLQQPAFLSLLRNP